MRRNARLCALLHIDVKKEVQDDETKDELETQGEGWYIGADGDWVSVIVAAVDGRGRGDRVCRCLDGDGSLGCGVALS